MTARESLLELIDDLTDEEIADLVRELRSRFDSDDPLPMKLRAAPYDDEPLSEEDRRAIQEGREELARGEGIPIEEVEGRLGL